MDAFREVCDSIAGLLFLVGYFPYILAIIRRKSDPKKATWIIWSINDTIVLFGMKAENALNGQILGVCVGAWVVFFFVVVLKYGTPGWTRTEKFSLASAAIGVLLWDLSDNALVGIVMSLSIGVAGFIPTLVGAWNKPEDEDKLGWTLWWVSCFPALLAIPERTFAAIAQPLVFAVMTSLMFAVLYFKARK